jgi:tetratricopeptide (TPR) repeat protein
MTSSEVALRRSAVLAVAAVLSWGGFWLGSAGAETPSQAGGSTEALALAAEAQLRLGAGEIADGLKLLRRATEIDPDSAGLAEEFGLALADAGMSDEAIKQFRRTGGDLSPNGEATFGILLAQAAQTPADLDVAIKHLELGVDAVPQGGQARLVLAQSLIRLDRGAEAWEQVRFLLDERPNDPRLWILAGESQRLMGKLDEAAGWFRRAMAVPEIHQRATLELVDTLTAARKFKEAADVLGELLRKEGATLSGLTRWATLLARSGDKDKARQVLDEVLVGDPNQRDALVLKAMIEASDGHIDAAERTYRKVLAAHPDDADAEMGLVRLLMDDRQLAEARTLLDGLWKEAESGKLAGEDAASEVAQERAALELLDHRADDALPWLKRARGKALTRRELALWGEYYRQRDAYAEGLAFVRAARAEDDEDAVRLRSSLEAEFALATGDQAAANAILDRMFAGSADQVVSALAVLDRRKLFKEAVARAKQAIARLGDDPPLQFAYAAALERSGSWDDAVTQFRKLIATEPDNASALNYLGYMFADRNVHLDEARTMLTKAVDLEPTSGAFQDSLGWVYFRLGELDRAEKHLTEALRLDPFDATLREHVGDLYLARGDKVKAADEYRRALNLGPEEAGQKERIEKKLAEVAGAPAP